MEDRNKVIRGYGLSEGLVVESKIFFNYFICRDSMF